MGLHDELSGCREFLGIHWLLFLSHHWFIWGFETVIQENYKSTTYVQVIFEQETLDKVGTNHFHKITSSQSLNKLKRLKDHGSW